MKKLLIIISLSMMVLAPVAMAETLTVDAPDTPLSQDQTFYVHIRVDDNSELLGAAFSVKYPNDGLYVDPSYGIGGVTSDFFQTFQVQFTNANPDYTGETSVEVGGISYDKPLVSNEAQGDVGHDLIRIAAARCQRETDSSKTTLFTIRFGFVEGGSDGPHNISIVPTELEGVPGYDEINSKLVNMLVGRDENNDTYPVLIDPQNYEQYITNAQVQGGGTSSEVEINLVKGWNLISLPVNPNDGSLSALFPDAEIAYKYINGAGYESVTTLEAGVGYWVRMTNGATYTVSGSNHLSYTLLSLSTGWHLLGAVSSEATPTTSSGESPLMYRYDPANGYQKADKLPPTCGVWVRLEEQSDFSVGK